MTNKKQGMNAPFSYFGGKSRLAKTIIELIPTHKTYAEVFGGAAWILFKKPPVSLEALNDLDKYLMNFYRVTKHHMAALIDEVITLQPGRDIFYMLRDDLERPTLTDIQKAAIYYYLQRFAFCGRPNKPTLDVSPGRIPNFRPELARRVLPLVAERLKSVMLENLPWDRFIKLYDSADTFFFIDPPYIGHNEYRHNFIADDFNQLADVLNNLKGKFLMTHSDTPQIRSLFKDCNMEPVQVGYCASHGKGKATGQELLIRNY
ncbi:adenine methyltransferase [Deltaproteobacteria bacterium Smac51]|nr:adenine methyltransferase [Deltaproteobacteria bacterium Smac51]UQZ90501.1 adenine methyltransferase [Deltaproteobacteria bacterium Smac51]